MLQSKNNLPESDPGLTLTPEAVAHLQGAIQKMAPRPTGIRVGIKKAGCTGYEYTLQFSYADSQTPDDCVFEFEGMQVLIDKNTYAKFFKGGVVMDYHQNGMHSSLHFDNPNVAHHCGCGDSFNLVDEQ